MKRASGHEQRPVELPTCPRCLLPVVPSEEEEKLGPQCKAHKFQQHSECLSYVQAHGDGCPFCRPEIRALGRGAFGRLVCERMANATEDERLQLRGQAVLVTIASKGKEEIMALMESRAMSIACDNAGRGDIPLVRDALELICLVCRVWVNGQDIAGFTSACHVVAREMRRLYNPNANTDASSTFSVLRNLVVSACLSLARLSTALALTLADDKIIDLLVRNLRAQADQQAQVESIVILATLSAHKPLASRLITSGVHLAALDLLPRVVAATAVVPITIGSLEVSTNGLPAIGLSTAEQLTNRDREAMLAARTQRSSIAEGSAHERGAASQTVTGEGDGGAPSKKDPKLAYLVSLLADLCEFGVPYEEMDSSSALCARLVKGVLVKHISNHHLATECCRAIMAIAAGSDDCAEALGQSGACEALVHILGLSSIPHKLLCNVLEGIHDLCQAEGSTNQDRFLACQAPQKVVKILASLSSLSSSEDPQAMMACLRAIRALATAHEANAHALGNETMLQLKDVSKTFRDNQEVVAECGETIAVLTEAVCTANGKSETGEVEDPASTDVGDSSIPPVLSTGGGGKGGKQSQKTKKDTIAKASEAGLGALPDLLRRDSAYDALQRAISSPPLSARRPACQLSLSNRGMPATPTPSRSLRGSLPGTSSGTVLASSSRASLSNSGRDSPAPALSPTSFVEQSARLSTSTSNGALANILGQSQSGYRSSSFSVGDPRPMGDSLRTPLLKSGGISQRSSSPPPQQKAQSPSSRDVARASTVKDAASF